MVGAVARRRPPPPPKTEHRAERGGHWQASYLQILRSELLFQCRVLLDAAADLQATTESLTQASAVFAVTNEGAEDAVRRGFGLDSAAWQALSRAVDEKNEAAFGVWLALQQLLGAASIIARLLWGTGGKKKAQRSALRQSVGMPDKSPLQHVALRDHWEHIDDKIDAWFESTNGVFVARAIGGPPTWTVNGEPLSNRSNFRRYDPATGAVSFWEHAVSVPVLVEATEAMLARLQEAPATASPAAAP